MKRLISALILFIILIFSASAVFAEGEIISIDPVYSNDEYKDLLMDAFDQTVLGQNVGLRAQLKKLLYLDEISVDATAYNTIVSAVKNAVSSEQLSQNASLESYTASDLRIAADLIEKICTALHLDFSIDPSIDPQNEYAKVITIRKDGILLGKINADAKTDVTNHPSKLLLVFSGILSLAGIGLLISLLLHGEKRQYGSDS